jgi:hypothetical protein
MGLLLFDADYTDMPIGTGMLVRERRWKNPDENLRMKMLPQKIDLAVQHGFSGM